MNYALSIEILRRFAPQNDIVGVSVPRRPAVCRLLSVICCLVCHSERSEESLNNKICCQTLRSAQGDSLNIILRNEVTNNLKKHAFPINKKWIVGNKKTP